MACGIFLAGTVGLFVGVVDAANYTALCGLVLGLYGGSNVAARYVEKRHSGAPVGPNEEGEA